MRRVVLSALVASLLAGCLHEEPQKPSAGAVSYTSTFSSAPTTSVNPPATALDASRKRVGMHVSRTPNDAKR